MQTRKREQIFSPFQLVVAVLATLLLLFGGIRLYQLSVSTQASNTGNVDLLGWGDNQFGQIGDGHLLANGTVATPKQFTLNNIKTIDSGLNHSLALTNDGQVYSWGENRYGQLGAGKIGGVRPSPKLINGLHDIIEIAAGQDHSLALDKYGRIWAWGLNMSGQLGDVTNKDNPHPQLMLGMVKVKHIAAGYRSSLAVKDDGSVWAWGGFCNLKTRSKNLQNYVESLSLSGYGDGNSSTIDSITPEEDCFYEDYLGVKSYQPVQIQGLPAIDRVSIGWGQTLALSENGEVWAWGCNMYGQVGAGKGPTTPAIHTPVQIKGLGQAIEVAAGFRHSLVLNKEGKLWGWGHNYFGEIGSGKRDQLVTRPKIIETPSEISHIYAGHDYTLALGSNGQLWGMGQSISGQLAQQTEYKATMVRVTDHHFSTVAAGGAHVIAIEK